MKPQTPLRTARAGHLRARFRNTLSATRRIAVRALCSIFAEYLDATRGMPCLGPVHHCFYKPFCISMLARLKPRRRRTCIRFAGMNPATFVHRYHGWRDPNYTRRDAHAAQ